MDIFEALIECNDKTSTYVRSILTGLGFTLGPMEGNVFEVSNGTETWYVSWDFTEDMSGKMWEARQKGDDEGER